MNNSTLSVVITACNEQEKLPHQLAAIMSQLTSNDELCLLDDGSTDDTWEIMWEHIKRSGCNDSPLSWTRNPKPSGCNRAYNQVTAMATKEWVYSASANDLVLPGAFDAFRKAVAQWQDAVVIAGRQDPPMPVGWACENCFLSPEEVRIRWRGIIQIGGLSAFTRRSFREPYDEELEWNADWWMLNKLILQHGFVFIDRTIARVGPSGYDWRGEDMNQLRPVINAMLRRLDDDPFLAEAFNNNPVVMQWLKTGKH